MAEAFGIAAGVAGLISLTDIIFSKTLPFLKEVKTQCEEISRLSAQVASLAGVLHSLRLLAEANAISINHDDIFQCQKMLEGMQNRLKQIDDPPVGKREKIKGWGKQLHFPYEKAELEKILAQLKHYNSTFTMAMTADNIKSQIEIQTSIKEVKSELLSRKQFDERVRVDAARQKVLDYFGRVSPKENHAMSMKLRHPGTGLWLLEEPYFEKWLQKDTSHIWLHGIPGAGKTVLASIIIEKARETCLPSEALAYFYCDYKDTAKQDTNYILASIASQIATQNERAFLILEDWYHQTHPKTNDVKHLKTQTLLNVLKQQLAHFSFVTVVIDGLDECGNNTPDVLDYIMQLIQEFKSKFRLAILSRDEDDICSRILETGCKRICIAASSSDIRLYAAAQLEDRIRTRRLLFNETETKEVILTTLIKKAQGMFRWVACQLDYICDFSSDREYREALDGPAPTLFEIYERILLRIKVKPKSTQNLVIRVLRCILFAADRLTTSELSEAVAVQIGSDEKKKPVSIDQIRRFCSSFVRESSNGRCLEVAHFTVQEFFGNLTFHTHPHLAEFCLSRPDSELELGKICSTYLQFKCFVGLLLTQEEIGSLLTRNPFYEHAATYWHLYSAEKWDNINLELAKKLFQPPMSTKFKLWRYYNLVLLDNAPPHRINHLGDSFLHWAVILQKFQLIPWLITSGEDPNLSSGWGKPLYTALATSNEFSLWNVSYDEKSKNSLEDLWLYHGDENSHDKRACIKALVHNGAQTECVYDLHINDHKYSLSLGEILLFSTDIEFYETEDFAFHFFDHEVASRIRKIFEFTTWEYEDYALIFTHMLRKLSKRFIDTSFEPHFFGFILELIGLSELHPINNISDEISQAAQNDQSDVLASYLESYWALWVDVCEDGSLGDEQSEVLDGEGSQEGDGGESPLRGNKPAISTDGHVDDVSGGDIPDAADWESAENKSQDNQEGSESDQEDKEYTESGMNAIMHAASAGSFECIKLLLNFRARVDISTKNGTNSLHFAAASSVFGAKRCLELLIEAGVDCTLLTAKNETALHFAARSGTVQSVKFLLEKGVDPDLRDDKGENAFDLAGRRKSGGEILELLEKYRKS